MVLFIDFVRVRLAFICRVIFPSRDLPLLNCVGTIVDEFIEIAEFGLVSVGFVGCNTCKVVYEFYLSCI